MLDGIYNRYFDLFYFILRLRRYIVWSRSYMVTRLQSSYKLDKSRGKKKIEIKIARFQNGFAIGEFVYTRIFPLDSSRPEKRIPADTFLKRTKYTRRLAQNDDRAGVKGRSHEINKKNDDDVLSRTSATVVLGHSVHVYIRFVYIHLYYIL